MLSRETCLVSVGNNINSRWSPVAPPTISRALLPMTSKVEKLSMDTEPDARDNSTIFTLKLGDQTFVAPYSTDNRGNPVSIRPMASENICTICFKNFHTKYGSVSPQNR